MLLLFIPFSMLDVMLPHSKLPLFYLLLCFCMGCSASSVHNDAIISLCPAITETVFFLEAQSQLCGRSDYCTMPPASLSLPSFGTSLTPNYEALALAQPKMVLVDASNGTPVQEIEKIVPVTQLPWLTIEEIESSIVELGKIFHKEEKAQSLAQSLHTSMQSTVTENSPSVLVLMADSDIDAGQIWFIRHDSVHGTAIEAAGFRNGAPAHFQGSPNMSVETLLEQNPEIILFLTSRKIDSAEEQTLLQSLEKFPSLHAVQSKHIGVLNGENLMGIGPNMIHLSKQIQDTVQTILEAN